MTKLTRDEAKVVTDLMGMPALTASGLIEALEAIVKEHGDLPVIMHDDAPVRELCAYDADGNTRGQRVEIVLHGFR